jgi:hypothetical protein
MNWIKKFIPGYIEIRSLYWVEYAKQMDHELANIFNAIDNDQYKVAAVLIKFFDKKHNQSTVPTWVGLKMSEIHSAKSMLTFLSAEEEV